MLFFIGTSTSVLTFKFLIMLSFSELVFELMNWVFCFLYGRGGILNTESALFGITFEDFSFMGYMGGRIGDFLDAII